VMSRLVDVICTNEEYEKGVESGKLLVEEHLAVVSYVIPAKVLFNSGNQIIIQDSVMLILKSKDVVFPNKLKPRLKELFCQRGVVLPIVEVVPDYRAWVEKEVYE